MIGFSGRAKGKLGGMVVGWAVGEGWDGVNRTILLQSHRRESEQPANARSDGPMARVRARAKEAEMERSDFSQDFPATVRLVRARLDPSDS